LRIHRNLLQKITKTTVMMEGQRITEKSARWMDLNSKMTTENAL
jgi:hypothetical protein